MKYLIHYKTDIKNKIRKRWYFQLLCVKKVLLSKRGKTTCRKHLTLICAGRSQVITKNRTEKQNFS